MKVIYTAPNRADHYRYASSLYKANFLLVFVSGFSRFSLKAAFHEIKDKLIRAYILQTLYLQSLKIGLPLKFSAKLAYWAKIEQDVACRKFIKHADVFLFYNGSGSYL
jgi:starch synthase